ncbi:MAG: RDD family protein [Dysgonamonadaceae bacterium]|jgi:uncharacterized RDD family membrane protein YckC|nr:RDD family protein [Dysgonamonadaceae bacterium]
MESIDVLTGQHVTIKYEPASVIQRMGAILLDSLFMGLYAIALMGLMFALLYNTFSEKIGLFFVLGILYLPIICYHVLFESLMNGQTPGKSILKIKVTNVDGSTPGFLAYFLRWILRPIDMFPYGGIGAFCIIFSKNHQRLGDMAAGTVVVKMSTTSSKYNLNNDFYEFEEKYQPTYKEADQLSEGQIRLISNLLQDPANKSETEYAIILLAEKIRKKLNINSKQNDRDFLETIVKDYNHYAALEI